MLNICFFFQVHQPFRLRDYLFFDIGKKHNYYDETVNRDIIKKIAADSYQPANKLFSKMIREYGDVVKLSFNISGTALDQMEKYTPRALSGFQNLVSTGNIELLGTTYSHSLGFLKNQEVFSSEIERHQLKLQEVFNKTATVYSNPCLIYSDDQNQMLSNYGYSAVLTEGAKSVLKNQSANFVYTSEAFPSLKILFRNFHLSDDINLRFSNNSWNQWPLTAEKYYGWLKKLDKTDEVLNIWIDYYTFGEYHHSKNDILGFFEKLFSLLANDNEINLANPSCLNGKQEDLKLISVPHPVSCSNDQTISPWLENDMQKEAFDALYKHYLKISFISDPELLQDWSYLQSGDHFYYMSTKYEEQHRCFNPYPSPYDAFINYMNVISDFNLRVDSNLKKSTPTASKIG